MSKKGVLDVGKIFSDMQILKIKLLSGDKQDFKLAHVLEKGKEAMKHDFCKATIEE